MQLAKRLSKKGIVTSRISSPEIDFIRESALLGRKWRARADERLKPEGLTYARATVLFWLDTLPGVVSQRELAGIVGIEGPTLVRLLHALESQGLIERVPMPADRRAKGIRLTERAGPMLDTIARVSDGMTRDYLDKLDKRRLASATRLALDARLALE